MTNTIPFNALNADITHSWSKNWPSITLNGSVVRAKEPFMANIQNRSPSVINEEVNVIYKNINTTLLSKEVLS